MAKKNFILGILSLFLILGMRVMPVNAINSENSNYLIKTAQLYKDNGKEFLKDEELSFRKEGISKFR